MKCSNCQSNIWLTDAKTGRRTCKVCGAPRPTEDSSQTPTTLAFFDKSKKMLATAKPKPVASKKSSQSEENAIKKVLRDQILGYLKVYGKDTVMPWLEEIVEEARTKKVEEYFT